jgi:hypothetical protein
MNTFISRRKWDNKQNWNNKDKMFLVKSKQSKWNFKKVIQLIPPTTLAARSKAWTVFARSDASRSQWPRGLRHELSSPPQTLGSCVRIPLEAWMSVCVYSVFVLSCVQVVNLRRADPPSKESYRLCKRSRNWKSGQGPLKGCRVLDR